MKIKQHLPSYVDAEIQTAEVNTLEEVLELPWVIIWSDFNVPNEKFEKFSRVQIGNLHALMAEFTNSWYVVGYVEGDLLESLPQWRDSGDPLVMVWTGDE